MMLPETTSSARVARAFRRCARGALVGLALGALTGCEYLNDRTTKPAQTPEMETTPPPEMTITPAPAPAVTVKLEHRQDSETQGVVGVNVVNVEGRTTEWRSQPLGSYFDSPDGTQLEFAVSSKTESIATATIQDSRLVIGAFTSSGSVEVTATSATDPANGASLTFRFTVGNNSAPAIADPGDKTYDRGDAIAPFGVEVSDADGDTVTVSVSGLPGGLAYSQATGQVSGTVAADAAARDHTVTVTANDGVNDPVTATFTIQVWKLVAQTLAVAADNARRVQTPFSAQIGRPPINNVPQAQQVARQEYDNFPPASFNPSTRTAAQITAAWTALAVTAATTYCAAQPRGDDPDDPAYAYRAESAATGSEGWAYSSNQNTYANTYQYFARKTRTWTATCERTVRRLDE